MKPGFFKIFGFFGYVSNWAAKALQPDKDGVVRITTEEAGELIKGMCETFGWQAEISIPQESLPDPEK